MRRQDREISDLHEIREILRRSELCFLGLCNGGDPYIVPMNFGFKEEKGQIYFYLHSAKCGKKLDLICCNPNVCIAFGTMLSFVDGQKGCEATAEYESVICFGTAEILTDPAECKKGLSCLLSHYQSKADHDLSALLEKTAVIRITAHTITGKTNRKEAL